MRKASLIIIIFLTGLLNSCAVYVPSMPDIARLEQGGDVEVGASVSIQNGLEFSTAYSPIDHLGLQLYVGGFRIDQWPMLYRGAVGYYLPFENRTTLAFYGGMSQGFSTYTGSTTAYSYIFDSKFNTAFLEADYGWRVCDWFEMSARLAAGAMWYTADEHRSYNDPSRSDTHEELNGRSPMLEPMIQLRLGTEYLKVNVKAGLTWVPNITQYYFPLQVGLGLSLHLPTDIKLK